MSERRTERKRESIITRAGCRSTQELAAKKPHSKRKRTNGKRTFACACIHLLDVHFCRFYFLPSPATSNRKKTPRKTLVYSILYGLIKMCQNETRSTHQDEAKVYAMLSNKQLVFVFPRGCMMRASCRCNSFIIAEFGSLDLELCVIHDFS